MSNSNTNNNHKKETCPRCKKETDILFQYYKASTPLCRECLNIVLKESSKLDKGGK